MPTRRALSLSFIGLAFSMLSACSGSDATDVDPSAPGADPGKAAAHDGSANAVTPPSLDHDSGAVTATDGGHGPGTGDGGGHGEGGNNPLNDAGAANGFGAACTDDGQCSSGFPKCFNYNAKGKHCTKTCKKATQAVDCPAPSTGCNGQGVCKL